MSAAPLPGGSGPVTVACRDQLAFVDFCITGLGLEIGGWDAQGGRVLAPDGEVLVRVVEGEPVAVEVAFATGSAAWLGEIAAMAAAWAAQVAREESRGGGGGADGGALVIAGPELVTWRITV